MNAGSLVHRRLWGLVIWIGVAGAPDAMAQATADPASLQWAVPTTLPTSALVAVAAGDPTGPGESTFLIAMPNGYRIPPHLHPGPTRVEVREGRLLVGMGDRLDSKRARVLAAGDSATVPAGMPHYWIARGRTVVSLTFFGPFTITYLRAVDAPRRGVFPFGY
jgi:quercetin dioxygenase-like cupin family protein